MAIDRRTLEGIEACRPGSEDLQSAELADVARRVHDDPEVGAVYARAQAWDTAVAAAMPRVPVPADLAQRILKALSSGLATSQSVDTESGVETEAIGTALAAGTPTTTDTAVAPAPSPSAWPRRRWLAAGSAVAATVIVGVFLTQYLGRGDETALETLAEGWMADLQPTWQNLANAPSRFEIPRAVTARATGWQRIGKIGGVRGVAYELTHATAGTARLFVVPLARSGLPTSPPAAPQSTTGGKSIGYWRSGGLVYVLVVNGNARSYRAFVSTARMPVA